MKVCYKNNGEIIPFNDVWYLDCFYHGLAQIANIYGFLDRLFENDYFEYHFTIYEGMPTLNLIAKRFTNWENVFKQNGIDLQFKLATDNVLYEIKEELRTGSLILLPIDCYYEDIRKDCYQKKHMPHNLVMYGYDDNLNEFLILEHNYENDLKYKKRKISCESAIASHLACSSLLKNNQCNRIIFKQKEKVYRSQYELTKSFSKGINTFFDSLDNLESFYQCFVNLANSDWYKENAAEFVSFYKKMFERIYNAKKYQCYFYQNALKTSLNNKLNRFTTVESCNRWGIIVAIFAKFAYKNDFSTNLTDRVIKYLQLIVEDEIGWKKIWTK